MLKLFIRRHGMPNRTYNMFSKNIEVKSNREKIYACQVPISVRFASTGGGVDKSNLLYNIPEPPPIPEGSAVGDITEIFQSLAVNGEPTFASLGLGGWGPIGIIQNCFEYIHVTYDVPWWCAILIGTIVVRSLTFPLVVLSQRNAAKMNHCLPEMQEIQLKLTEAKQTGNDFQSARYSQELMLFMKEKGVSPLRNMIAPVAQAPLFISFFLGLRGMAYCPVQSMTTGGLWWFTDLTVPDQYYLLPVIMCTSMWLSIEMGVDGAKMPGAMQWMKYVLRAIPVIVFPFAINFPGAIVLYWSLTNFISLCQAGMLKIPACRAVLKIPPLIKHPPSSLPIQNKGMIESLKESWTNLQQNRLLADVKRIDEIKFTSAGKGAIQKTFEYDPTKANIHLNKRRK